MQVINAKQAATKNSDALEVEVYLDGFTPASVGITKATFVPDPASDTPTKAEFIALRDAMVSAGIMNAS